MCQEIEVELVRGLSDLSSMTIRKLLLETYNNILGIIVVPPFPENDTFDFQTIRV